MKPSIYRISLDVHDAHSSVCLDMMKQDTARQISIALTDGGFPYRISEECYAVFAATKADGKKLLHHCEIRNNIIQYIVRPQTTAAIGLMECEIKLYGANDKLLFSPGFNILVSENAVTDDDDLISEDDVDELTHLISEAAKVIAEGEEVNAESRALIDDMEAKREVLDQQIQETGSAAANAHRYAQLASQASQSASNSSSIAYNRAQDAQTAAGNAKTSENNAKTSAQTAVNMANAALQSQRAAEDAAKRAEEAAANTGGGPDSGQNPTETSIFAGKTAFFYGDSLTEANYHYSKGYHKWVSEILGLASYNNYGKSGYKVSDVYNKVNSVTDTADIIFVMCGINDQNFSVPLGAMGDTTTGTTYGALNLLCALLKQKYPTKLVVFITPHYQTKYPHSAGITSYEVSKAVREVCEKYAIPVYDNFVLSGIYSTNLSTFTTDNCHWNNTAHEMVGKNLARFVSDSFRYLYDGEADSGGEEEPEITLSSISAVFNQGDAVVYNTDTLDSLKPYLTVTAHYSDNSTKTVADYTLSGTLTEGTSLITVSYDGKTTTFSATVTARTTATVTATFKKAEISNTSHIGFLVEGPVGTEATIRLECDLDDSTKFKTANNMPFVYDSVDNFNVGTYKKYGNQSNLTIENNHVVASKVYTSDYPYWAMFLPFDVSSVPVSVTISNVHVYVDDVPKTILSVGTFKNNITGGYVEFTVT